MKPRLLVCAGTLAALSAAGQTVPAAKPAAAVKTAAP